MTFRLALKSDLEALWQDVLDLVGRHTHEGFSDLDVSGTLKVNGVDVMNKISTLESKIPSSSTVISIEYINSLNED